MNGGPVKDGDMDSRGSRLYHLKQQTCVNTRDPFTFMQELIWPACYSCPGGGNAGNSAGAAGNTAGFFFNSSSKYVTAVLS
jgi:hypothetical protein